MFHKVVWQRAVCGETFSNCFTAKNLLENQPVKGFWKSVEILSATEVSLRTGLAPVSDQITRGRNAIFGHVARLPDTTPAHQAMLRQVELSVGRPETVHGNVHQVDHVPNGPTNSAAITTMLALRLCVEASHWSRSLESDATVRADYALTTTTLRFDRDITVTFAM